MYFGLNLAYAQTITQVPVIFLMPSLLIQCQCLLVLQIDVASLHDVELITLYRCMICTVRNVSWFLEIKNENKKYLRNE